MTEINITSPTGLVELTNENDDLSTEIARDFIKVIKDKEIDFFVNRIECFNPLTKENLIKMSDKVTEVTKNILPAHGCYYK